MSVVIQDNFSLAAAKAVDNRYEKVTSGGVSIPYAKLSEAYTAIPLVYRHIGLTVAIDNGSGGANEYWFKNDTTTLVPKSGAVSDAKNGLTLDTDGKIKLGGSIIENTTVSNTSNKTLLFDFTDSTRYSQINIDKFNPYMQAGDFPNAWQTATSGSKSRAIIFKSSAAIWTNNYVSYAYEADQRWTAAHPLAPANSSNAYGFQIFDNLVSTGTTSALLAHYYDERVGNPNWQDTWTSGHTLVSGKVYTLRIKKAGDNFPGSMGTTISGSANTSGWVFTSNGNQPTVWTNGSTVDGDYPVIEVDPKFSSIACQEASSGDYVGKGVTYVRGNGLLVNTVIDQRGSVSRGLLLGRFTTGTRPKSSVVPIKQGELFYNATDNRLEFFISTSSGNDTWGVVTNTTTTYPSS
jgi:hypothetical protein